MKHVTILIGSNSDKNIADKVTEVLEKYGVPYNLEQASAHREPEKVREIVKNSQADVFICIAGLSAALPGVVASLTPKPVIGVPKDVKLGGLDALLSIAQMPSGVPVATVGIDNGKNAAYLAIRILGLQYPEVLRPRETAQNFQYSSGESSGSTTNLPSGTFSMFSQTSMTSGVPPTQNTEENPKKEEPRGDWL